MKHGSSGLGPVWVMVGLLGWTVVLSAGCRSVYHRAEQQLPADPRERLAMRVQAARDAAADGLVALEQTDAARAEQAGWNLSKAVASLGDVLERVEHGAVEVELHRTLGRSSEALVAGADALAGGAERGDRTVSAAKDSLRAALAEADRYLASAPPPGG